MAMTVSLQSNQLQRHLRRKVLRDPGLIVARNHATSGLTPPGAGRCAVQCGGGPAGREAAHGGTQGGPHRCAVPRGGRLPLRAPHPALPGAQAAGGEPCVQEHNAVRQAVLGPVTAPGTSTGAQRGCATSVPRMLQLPLLPPTASAAAPGTGNDLPNLQGSYQPACPRSVGHLRV